MKFTDGYWRNRNDFNIYNVAEVYDIKIENDALSLLCPHFNIQNRGQTLCGPLLNITLSSPMENIISVKIEHYKGLIDKGPNYNLNKTTAYKATVKQINDEYTIKSGNLKAIVKKDGQWNLSFFNNNEKITGNGWRSTAYISDSSSNGYIKEQLSLAVDECVYGFGERFTPFVKNGQVVDIWNADGGTSSELSYKNIPFYITNKGYGVFVNNPGKVSFEIASENVSRIQFSVQGESLEYFIINGPKLKDVLTRYTSLTGKPALPPAWSFGLWLSTSFITNYDEKTVNSFIDGMNNRDIPLNVFHFDCFWMKEYSWTSFQWDERVFPEPENMLKRIKAKGLKVCVWINPYISQQSELFEEGKNNNYLLRKPNGDVWQCDDWQPGMGIVDFTNSAACLWYQSKLKKLIEMGVDCFKTDFGERIPEDVVYSDGSDPHKMHNYYSYLYNKTVYDILYQESKNKQVLVFARSGTVGNQKFPVHWGGDCSASYESMAESLRGGLSLCLSGYGFWSHDIAGFENTASPDLYKRWVAFGLLSSHSRLHGNMSYRVPWNFDNESCEVLKFFTKLKCKLMPYIFSKAVESSKIGLPLMRAMIIEFQDDPCCAYLDKQYMLGESIMVAPIFRPDSEVRFYLPDGIWTDYLSGEILKGGSWITKKYDYLSLPLLIKENTILPIGYIDNKTDYDYFNKIEFHVFEQNNNSTLNRTIYNSDNTNSIEIHITKTNDQIRINLQGICNNYTVILHGIFSVTSIKNGTYEVVEKGIKIIPDNIEKMIIVNLI